MIPGASPSSSSSLPIYFNRALINQMCLFLLLLRFDYNSAYHNVLIGYTELVVSIRLSYCTAQQCGFYLQFTIDAGSAFKAATRNDIYVIVDNLLQCNVLNAICWDLPNDGFHEAPIHVSPEPGCRVIFQIHWVFPCFSLEGERNKRLKESEERTKRETSSSLKAI